MANNFTSSTLDGTYNDDFNASDNYHQILFNNGRALQARELTQLQTILSEQISRFGRNIFKEGAPVTNSGVFIDNKVDFVTIGAINSGGSFDDIPVGTTFTASSNGLQARVLAVKPADADFTYDTLYIQYISNASATPGSTQLTFGNLDTLTGGGYELTSRATNAAGKATRFSVEAGIFFALGKFIRSDAQDIYVSSYGQSFDGTVGFKVVQDVVTVNDTSTLYDNANGIVNTTSPGADRYRISLTLIDEADITSTDTFVFLARIENSQIVEASTSNNQYNLINDMIAQRTYEESGNYVVNPPMLTVDSDETDPNSLLLTIGEGTAYVNGYRVEQPKPVKLRLPKPQSTLLENNDTIGINYGNYVIAGYDSSSRGLPELNERYLFMDANGDFNGSARIKHVENIGRRTDAGGKYNQAMKIHLYDLLDSSTAGTSLQTARKLIRGANDFFTLDADPTQANRATKIEEANQNTNLFPVSRPRPEQLTDVIVTTQIQYRAQKNGASAGNLVLPQLPVGSSYVDTSLWLVGDSNNPLTTMSDTTITLSNNDRDATISSLAGHPSYEVLTYVQKTGTIGAKTLTTTDSNFLVRPYAPRGSSGVQQGKFIDLKVPDIYEVDEVRFHNADGPDLKNFFIMDNGQRDNYYGLGRMYLDSSYGGLDSAGRKVHVSFKHFTGRTGDFFTAQSYPVSYNNIPDHKTADGTIVNLRDFLDFRPDVDTVGDVVTQTRGIPRDGDNVTADADYFLPRADKVLMTAEGKIQVLMGQQAENPQFKKTPDNSLELYKLLVNANATGPDDVQVTPIEHKRYTMADIAKLEAKLDRHVEYTQLSLLELESKLTPLLDSDGVARTELCTVTDDISDQSQADTDDDGYNASTDPESGIYRPGHEEYNLRLIKDLGLSQNVTFTGDNAYINYSTESWKSQPLATTSRKVVGNAPHTEVGTLTLSPSSDEFRDTYTPADRALPGVSRISRRQAFLWNNWLWNWQGRTIEDLFSNPDERYQSAAKALNANRRTKRNRGTRYLSSEATVPGQNSAQFTQRIVPSNSVRNIVNVGGSQRVIDLALIPFIRSRKIFFKAQGLKPNTKFTPFFDGTDVSTFCREETFVRWADRTDDEGNLYIRQSTHPDGSSDLISDANGAVEGSFFIPNLRLAQAIRRAGAPQRRQALVNSFKVGVKEFRLLDITVNNWDAANSKASSLYSAIGAINTKRQNIITTRNTKTVDGCWGNTAGGNRITPSFTAAQIKSAVDAATSADVLLIEPHLSGLWGREDAPVNPSSYVGSMAQILSDYVEIDQNQNAGSSILPQTAPVTPFAQSFRVDNQWGVMLTKASLYFKTRDTADIPVTIKIVPMENGVPSMVDEVPGSRVTVARDDVSIAGDQTQISNIVAAGTDFTFEEPVFLQPWTEYAIVVMTTSTEYEVFVGDAGEYVIGSTSRTFSAQSSPGMLFLPQAPYNATGSTGQDLMFDLTRASFDTTSSSGAGGNASLVLKHSNVPALLLEENPIRTTSGSTTIYVKHGCHGLRTGDRAVISGAVATGGITAGNINGERAVVSQDVDGYTVAAGSAATETLSGGGDAVTSERNIQFDLVNPYIENIVPNDCSLDISAKFTSGSSIAGSETDYQRETVYSRVSAGVNTEFSEPRMIASQVNGEDFLQENGANIASDISAYIKIDLKSGNEYVSPVIDLQRASLGMISNCIDDVTVNVPYQEVPETAPESGSAGSRHISEPIQLEQDGIGFETRFDCFVPEGAGVDFYYRVAGVDEDIRTRNWIAENTYNQPALDNVLNFREHIYLPGGQSGNLRSFQQMQTKIVFRSTNSSRVPLVRALKTRVLAT